MTLDDGQTESKTFIGSVRLVSTALKFVENAFQPRWCDAGAAIIDLNERFGAARARREEDAA